MRKTPLIRPQIIAPFPPAWIRSRADAGLRRQTAGTVEKCGGRFFGIALDSFCGPRGTAGNDPSDVRTKGHTLADEVSKDLNVES